MCRKAQMVDANPESCMRAQISLTTSWFRRFLHDDLAWDGRMSGPVGSRGVGKSTLFLQYARDHIQEERLLYVSADNVISLRTRWSNWRTHSAKVPGSLPEPKEAMS